MDLLTRVIGSLQDLSTSTFHGNEKPSEETSFYDLTDKDMDGNQVNMSDFKGHVLCVVNVASKWGFTNVSYTEFAQLVDEYGSRGFKVLAFPCNQFMSQEPVSFYFWFRFFRGRRMSKHEKSKLWYID